MQDFLDSRINFNFVSPNICFMMLSDEHIISNAIKHYTHLHQHPELSFEEFSTSMYVKSVLEATKIPYQTVGETGIIGWIAGKNSLRTIALRADIDALPIEETRSNPIISTQRGVMHACGHDLHTASLLGAAEYLNHHRDALQANIMLIFQHAEEVLPGGAIEVINHPFFKAHRPEWIFALHAEPELPVGDIGICPGQYMASGDEIYIHLEGPGGHAALPDKTSDLILIASHIVVALQQIVSRNASPFTPTVLTFGNIRCQSAMNIIPQGIILEGTLRTFDEKWRQNAKEHIQRISRSIAESMGAKIDINIVEGYPGLFNDPDKAEQTIRLLQTELGEEHVIMLSQRMTTEDFGRYSQIIPATFIRLGVKGESHHCGKLHTSGFFPDLSALKYGVCIFCSIAKL